MGNNIQELTDKIYREGVEKGNEEAQRLINEAQQKAQKLIADAQKEAESILPMLINRLMSWPRIQNRSLSCLLDRLSMH